ncbi:MAG: hypothetical protein IKG81_10875 [Bacteroidales bacterium]|nr:hypothetical protein [Bacteroidales bacterium]
MNKQCDMLAEPLGGTEVRKLAHELTANQLYNNLFHPDSRVARNAAWVLTHKTTSEIQTLPHDPLIELATTTSDTSLRRLVLNLVERQPLDKENLRTDFLDFCLTHMIMLEEPPGVQALCMKLVYRMCSFYPELLHEFYATLNLMQTEHHKPGLTHLIKKYLKQKDKHHSS